MAGVTQLCYLGLSVSDVAAWNRFATSQLGLQVVDEGDEGVSYLRMDEYHHRFVLHANGSDDLAYIGWQVPDAGALHALREHLERNGVAVSSGTEEECTARRVLELIKLQDPSGIPTEICYGPMIVTQPFIPGRPMTGFKTGDLGMGHLVAYERSLEDGVHFYRDLLGFRVSDHVRMPTPGGDRTMVFLRCNARHHSIAFTATPPLPKRIHHFMLECNSIDDVGFAHDLCKKQDLPIAAELGRHPVDQMFSFFMGNPSGFNVELGWGGRIVDEASWRVHYRRGGGWGHEGLANNPMRR